MSDMVNHPPHYTKGGIPWRYDFENMPKDGTSGLVWMKEAGGYLDCALWMDGKWYVGGEWYEESDFTAWCPINPPESGDKEKG